MLILNADDSGRSRAETDAVLRCYQEGRIFSVSAMVSSRIPKALLSWKAK
jgi:predicted glycoside hydrolase/deacetylase ChbG (UPF0249 family)